MYIVSTSEKKKVEEKIFFFDVDGRNITITIGWRFGKVWCEEEPDLSDYDEEEGADMAFLVDYVDEEQVDGWFFDVEADDGSLTDEEKEEIENAWNDGLEDGMRDIGWEWSDRELWFYGPLDIEEE